MTQSNGKRKKKVLLFRRDSVAYNANTEAFTVDIPDTWTMKLGPIPGQDKRYAAMFLFFHDEEGNCQAAFDNITSFRYEEVSLKRAEMKVDTP